MRSKRLLALLGTTALAGPLLTTGPLLAGPAAADEPSGRYIVVVRAGTTPDSVADLARRDGGDVRHVYRHALHGFAGTLPERVAQKLADHPAVAAVEPDGRASVDTTQVSPSWGLDRIDQRAGLDGLYNYTATGLGVTAYVIDTGVRATHVEFGGRVVSGFDAYGGTADDCNGHGTHVAGTVGGATYGVAKQVTIVAVRVLDCSGSGWWSDVIAGINWVTGHHVSGPAVANMSLGGGFVSTVNSAVAASVADGVSYAVAAGNSTLDACFFSPASTSVAMTVGATSPGDVEAYFSNYGSCVDWYAPGDGIVSAYNTNDVAVNALSGTSMASPHVAGVAAQYLQGNPSASPATVTAALAALLTQGAVTGNSDGYGNDDLLFTNL